MRRLTITCLIPLLLAAQAAGQGLRQEWETLSNPARLSFLEEDARSWAGLSFTKEDGSLVPIEGSDNSWTAKASTESFHRVGERLALQGSLSYSHFRGQNMGGQVLMDPSYNPINFLEEDLSSRGTKKRETYSLAGNLAYTLSRVVTLGAGIDYTAADQVKYKDPRFKNVWMDITLRPGVFLNLGKKFSLGANLEYRHTLETVSAGEFGTGDVIYRILVDRGNFYGPKELFEKDAGHISLSNERPLSNSFYGLSVQGVSHGKTRGLFQLTGLLRNGYFGKRSSSSVVFCEFSGMEFLFDGALIHDTGKNRHKAGLKTSLSLIDKYTNSYRSDPQPGMSNVIVYTGQSKDFSKMDVKAGLSYSLLAGMGGYLPAWEVNAAAMGQFKQQNLSLYPFSREWTSATLDVTLCARRNIIRDRNIFSVGLDAGFLMGFGNPREDHMAGGASSSFRSFDDYSNRQFEFETATRAGAGLTFKYIRRVSEKFAPYFLLSDHYQTLLSAPQYLDGAARNVAVIGVGLHF